uniref:Uncharacterized protein n=1 Tax=Anguilla anguilla TaxID=7936 RepID=A0A0E9XYN3_ANGAN
MWSAYLYYIVIKYIFCIVFIYLFIVVANVFGSWLVGWLLTFWSAILIDLACCRLLVNIF